MIYLTNKFGEYYWSISDDKLGAYYLSNLYDLMREQIKKWGFTYQTRPLDNWMKLNPQTDWWVWPFWGEGECPFSLEQLEFLDMKDYALTQLIEETKRK